MKRLSVILAGSTITLGLMGASGLHDRPDEARQLHLRAEQTRLRAHFDSVDNELKAASVSKLTGQQRAMRAKLISWLRDYRNAGAFPENDRFADRAMPFFRDSHGTLCAMAYLVDRSGRGDIVDRIAKTRNNAFIHELVDDPELVSWIAASGLSVDEAARIQPTYGPPPVIVVANGDRVAPNYALLSMGLGGVSLGSTGLNLFAPSRLSNAFGFIAGAGAIAAGASRIKDGGGTRRLAIANATIGSISVVTAIASSYWRAHRSAAAKSSVEKSRPAAVVSPEVLVLGPKQQFGLGLHARF